LRWIQAVATLLLLWALPVVAQGTAPSADEISRANELAAAGWAHMEKGDCRSLSLAERAFSEAVALLPMEADLHARLANAQVAEGLENIGNCAHNERERERYLNDAWSHLRTALNFDSTNTMYRVQFVALSQVLKRKPEYSGGVATEPDKAEVSQWLANKQIAPAPDSLQSLKALADQKIEAERSKIATAQQKDVVDAKNAILADPTNGFAWSKLGNAYYELGDFKNAYDATQKAVEIFREKFKTAPAPALCEGQKLWAQMQQPNGQSTIVCRDEARLNLSMLASSLHQMTFVCEKLRKKREAAHYRDLALKAYDVMRTMQSSSGTAAPSRSETQPMGTAQANPAPSTRTVAQCPRPVYEICRGPSSGSSDWRDYNRCQAGNQREVSGVKRSFPSTTFIIPDRCS